jgi:MFS transporter, FHS family, glucose/mannose:H+ symporter
MVPVPVIAVPDSSSPPHPPSERSLSQRTVAVVFSYFIVAGIATVMLGPALPLLAARWGMPDARLGSLFVAYFAGQFCGAWLATPRLRASLLLGAIVAGFGMLLLTFAGATAAHVALFCAGLGLGAGLTAGNVLVGTLDADASEQDPHQDSNQRGSSRSRNLALLNVAWGLGAIACPVLLSASLRLHAFRAQPGQLFFLALAAGFAVCAVLLALLLPRPSAGPATVAPASRQAQIPWQIFALFGATFMLYVGVENSLGGWLPIYAQRLSHGCILAERASAVALCFWVCELASRGLMAAMIKLLRERLVYRGCLAVLIATAASLVLVPHLSTVPVFAITAVAAFSLAPLYPLAVSFLLARTGNHPRVGKVFACASLGGTILPWLTGVLSTRFQSLRIGFAAPAVGAVLMLLLSLYLPDNDGKALKASQRLPAQTGSA